MIDIKLMGPLFSVFDRPTYRKLVPHHLYTLSQMPKEMVDALADGSFAVALSERRWHSVALDEAHETKINKACKQVASFPGSCVGGEKSAWYTLFAHAPNFPPYFQ